MSIQTDSFTAGSGKAARSVKANSNVLSIEDKKNEIKLTKTDNKDTDATTLKTAVLKLPRQRRSIAAINLRIIRLRPNRCLQTELHLSGN